MNVNLFVIPLYVTVIPKKLLAPVANTAFNADKNLVTVSLPGVILIVNVWVFAVWSTRTSLLL